MLACCFVFYCGSSGMQLVCSSRRVMWEKEMRLNQDTVKASNDIRIYTNLIYITFTSQTSTLSGTSMPQSIISWRHWSTAQQEVWPRKSWMPPLQGHSPDEEPTHGSISTLNSAIYFFSNLQVFQRYPVQPPNCATQWAYVMPKKIMFDHSFWASPPFNLWEIP